MEFKHDHRGRTKKAGAVIPARGLPPSAGKTNAPFIKVNFNYLKLENSTRYKDLIPLVVQGDQKAFQELFNLYSSKVYKYALRITRNKGLANILMESLLKL